MREVSLGLVIVLSLLALGTMIFLTGELPWERKGYTLTAKFDYVGGLKEGDAVRVAGVKVGKVLSISLREDGVYVTLLLSPGVEIKRGSLFTIGTSGIVGEKYVEVIPQPGEEVLKPGEKVEGVSPYRLEELINELRFSVQRFGKVMDDIEKLVGDQDFRDSIRSSAIRLNEVLEEAKESLARFKVIEEGLSERAFKLVDDLRQTVAENREEIRSILNNVRIATERFKDFAQRFATPENVEAIEGTLKSIKTAADEISLLAKGFSEKDIGRTIEDVRTTVEETRRIVEKVKTIKASGGARFRYGESSSSDKSEGFTDIWFRLDLPDEGDSIFVGLDDLGGEDELSILLEKRFGKSFVHRFGIIRGEPGYGILQELSPRFSWELALRSVKEPELDLSFWYRLLYRSDRKVFLFGRIDYQGGEVRPSLGIEYRF